jgi:predicted transcriptional regulator
VAGEDITKDILKIGIRKLERGIGVSHHTLDKILKGEPVRRKTLAKVVKHLRLFGKPNQSNVDTRKLPQHLTAFTIW